MSGRVLISVEHPSGAYAARVLRALARQFLSALGLEQAELSLVVTSDAGIRRLNRSFRGKDEPTDVLSFPCDDGPRPRGALRPLGDVVVSLDTARRRAAEDRRSVRAELARYLAHGLLHLLGHDHHEAAQARRMARAEKQLLGQVGLVGYDPDQADARGRARERAEARGPARARTRAGGEGGR